MGSRRRPPFTRTVALAAALLASACGDGGLLVPDAEEVESYYTIPALLGVEMNGNVAELEVRQSADQLRRGGRLWAMVGPYVYLFSEPTRDLFTDYDGLAAVRVTTRSPSGQRVARATLVRGELNGLTWQRALNIAGHARKSGTTRLTRLEDLVRWGEEHTEYEYNPDYASRR
jgi:hypothetical protein